MLILQLLTFPLLLRRLRSLTRARARARTLDRSFLLSFLPSTGSAAAWIFLAQQSPSPSPSTILQPLVCSVESSVKPFSVDTRQAGRQAGARNAHVRASAPFGLALFRGTKKTGNGDDK